MAYAGRSTPVRDPMGRRGAKQPIQSARSFREGLSAVSGVHSAKQEVARSVSLDDIRKKVHSGTVAQPKQQRRQRPIREADLDLDF